VTEDENDPTDDGTCPDPTDDNQTSKDVNNETNVLPIIASLGELVPYLIAPESAPAPWAEAASSPFLPLPRLRC